MTESPRRKARAKKAVKRRRRPVLTIAPEDRPPRFRSREDRLKDDARGGLRGLLVSLIAHALLLGFLALIIHEVRGVGEDQMILMSWLTETNSTTRRSQTELTLDSFQMKEPEKPTPEPTPDETPAPGIAESENVQLSDISHLLDGRSKSRRDLLLMKFGGDEQTRRAIEAGLLWLKRQQGKAGNWRLDEGYPDPGLSVISTDTGATALALLCYLGTGQTHLDGEHAQTVKKGLLWLQGAQKPTGDFHDHSQLGRQTAYYAHAQATIVLCEAYAMTGDPELRESAERGIRFLMRSQQPNMGGWKYRPMDDTMIADLSVTGWALMALHTARMAGIEFPPESFERGALFLDEVAERGGALYKYEPSNPASEVSVAMTAEGLLCRQYLGWPRQHPSLVQGVDYLLAPEHQPVWEAGKRNVYAWYYTGQVLHNLADQRWTTWYSSVQEAIVSKQVRTGSVSGGRDVRGSWHPNDPPGSPHEYADKAGRLYLTSMCLLILEMPFRHLPIYPEDNDLTGLPVPDPTAVGNRVSSVGNRLDRD